MNTIDVSIQVEPIITLLGKKLLYKLSDNAYGEWLIFEKGEPRYYLNIFDTEYNSLREKLGKSIDLEKFLEEKLKQTNSSLSIKNNLFGIRLFNKSYIKVLRLEKLPQSMLMK